MMKILIMKFRNIGDVLLSTSLVENLKAAFPDASIDFALNKNCADMITLNPNINKVIVYDREKIKKKTIFSRIWLEIQFARQMRKNNYDMVINLTEGDRGALFALFSRAKQRIGILPRNRLLARLKPFTASIKNIPSMHTVEKYLFPLKFLKITPLSKKVSLFWERETEKKIENLLSTHQIKQFIHIHPVARWLFKCWDDKRFAALIDYLELEKNFRVIITASPDKRELKKVNHIISHCSSTPLNLSGKLSLKEVACLSKKAKFFIGVDTAPMHMAAAVNTPVIALFGASEPHLWGPWDNELGTSHYQNLRITQKNGKHTIIQKGDDEIIIKEGEKISTSLMRIELEEVKKVLF